MTISLLSAPPRRVVLAYRPTLGRLVRPAFIACAIVTAPLAADAQRDRNDAPNPRRDSLRTAHGLDAGGNHSRARAIYQALIDNAPNAEAKAEAQRRLARPDSAERLAIASVMREYRQKVRAVLKPATGEAVSPSEMLALEQTWRTMWTEIASVVGEETRERIGRIPGR